MKYTLSILSALLIFYVSACSSSQETTNTDETAKEEIYVFDDPGTDVSTETDTVESQEMPEDTVNFISDEKPAYAEDNNIQAETNMEPEPHFIVQVGAFTTKDKADTFVKENQKEISYPMQVQYSTKVNLFVVWLPKFNSREKAESVRNSLWKKEKFKDAFIINME